jgi:hypothetical protein
MKIKELYKRSKKSVLLAQLFSYKKPFCVFVLGCDLQEGNIFPNSEVDIFGDY